MVFMGTSARSGAARALIVQTGAGTAFGQIAEKLTLRPPETEFERGIRHFGYLAHQIMTVLVLGVFAINVVLAKPAIDSLLFAIALAVGIAPELLPAIISINLSKGAQNMAKRGVIVRSSTPSKTWAAWTRSALTRPARSPWGGETGRSTGYEWEAIRRCAALGVSQRCIPDRSCQPPG